MNRRNPFGALDSESDSESEDLAPEPEDSVPVIKQASAVMPSTPLRILKGKRADDFCGVFSISANPTHKDKSKDKSKNAKEKQQPKRMLVPTGFTTPREQNKREEAQVRVLEIAKQKETDQKERELARRILVVSQGKTGQVSSSRPVPVSVLVSLRSKEEQYETALSAWNAKRLKFYDSIATLLDTIHFALFGSKAVPVWALPLYDGVDIYREMVSIYLFFNRGVLVEFLGKHRATASYVEFAIKQISCAIAEIRSDGLANIALLSAEIHQYLFEPQPVIGQLGNIGTTSPLSLPDFLPEFRDEFSALSGVYHVLRVMRVLPEEVCDEFHVRRDSVKIRSIFARWRDHKWFGEKEQIIFEFAIMAYKNSSHACAVPNFEPGVASHDFWRNMYHLILSLFDRDTIPKKSDYILTKHFAEMLSLHHGTIRDYAKDHYEMSAEKLEEAIVVLNASILAGIDEYSESRAKMEELRHGSHDCLYPFVRACSRIAAPWFIGLI